MSQHEKLSRAGRSERDQLYVLKAYSVIGFAALSIFGLLHIFVEGNGSLGQFELLIGAVILLNTLAIRVTHNLAIARVCFALSITSILLVLLITGGTQHTGIFWFFVFPNLAFFLMGKRQGLWWVGILGAATGTIVILSQFSVIHIPYDLLVIRQLLASMVVVAFGVYVYQGARERALQEADNSRQDLQEYLDHMTTFSMKISLSGAILLANKAAKEASGLGERLIGTHFLESPWWSFEPSVQDRVEAAFYEVLTGQPVNYDEQFMTVSSNGPAILTVNFSMLPILGKHKKLVYILAEARNISAERQIDRAKSEFIGLASRQLYEPTSDAMRLASRLLTEDARRLTEAQREDIRALYRSNQHMSALIRDMLLVSQLELGRLPVKPRPSKLPDICQAVLDDIKASLLQGRKLTVDEDYAKDLPVVSEDPEIMRLILHNLLSNAVKYTSDNGRVYLRLRRIDEKLQPESPGSLQIEIQDSGIGIPAADQKKVFTKFFHAGNRPQAAGSGLGLYMVKMLVAYVHGTIVFQSEENVGSIFIVTLPIEGMQAMAGEHSVY